MGRLFWKFFLVFWLSVLTAGIGVGAAVWLWHNTQTRETASNIDHNAHFVGAAGAVLQHSGIASLKSFLDESRGDRIPPVFAVNEQGEELLGRKLPVTLLEQARQLADTGSYPRAIRKIAADDGHTYLLFTPFPERKPPSDRRSPDRFPLLETRPPPPDAPPHGKPPQPILPIAAGLLASLMFSALLAWYFAKPIRHLRAAFDALSKGRLNTRAGPQMGNRRDELADLGRHFDLMAAQVRTLMDAQQQLLHDVSHELRSPLARMQAAIGLAYQRPEKTAASLHRIERESQRMSDLIGELLTLSRLEVDDSREPDDDIDLAELLHEIVEDARFEADSKKVRIEFSGFVEAIGKGRGKLIHRAVENVLRNAVQHTEKGSTLIVNAIFDNAGKHLLMTIDDQGPGVPEAELTRIFEPFFRGGDNRKQDSIGLGLTIARRAVEIHGGNISATNRPEGGLRVTIDIPFKPAWAARIG